MWYIYAYAYAHAYAVAIYVLARSNKKCYEQVWYSVIAAAIWNTRGSNAAAPGVMLNLYTSWHSHSRTTRPLKAFAVNSTSEFFLKISAAQEWMGILVNVLCVIFPRYCQTKKYMEAKKHNPWKQYLLWRTQLARYVIQLPCFLWTLAASIQFCWAWWSPWRKHMPGTASPK